MKTEKYEKVYIKSESDLPKDEEKVIYFRPYVGLYNYQYFLSMKEDWLENVSWYLRPIPEQTETVEAVNEPKQFCPNCGSISELYASLSKAHCPNCGKLWTVKVQPKQQPINTVTDGKPHSDANSQQDMADNYDVHVSLTKTNKSFKATLKRIKEAEKPKDTMTAEEILKDYAELAHNLALNDYDNKVYCVELSDAVKAMEEYHAQFKGQQPTVTDDAIKTASKDLSIISEGIEIPKEIADLNLEMLQTGFIIGAKAMRDSKIKH